MSIESRLSLKTHKCLLVATSRCLYYQQYFTGMLPSYWGLLTIIRQVGLMMIFDAMKCERFFDKTQHCNSLLQISIYAPLTRVLLDVHHQFTLRAASLQLLKSLRRILPIEHLIHNSLDLPFFHPRPDLPQIIR